MEVDFAQEKMQVARQAWQFLNLNFYDPKMHGVDWNAVWKKIEPRIAGAKTPDDMRRILSLMIGDLNASHTGVSGAFRKHQCRKAGRSVRSAGVREGWCSEGDAGPS